MKRLSIIALILFGLIGISRSVYAGSCDPGEPGSCPSGQDCCLPNAQCVPESTVCGTQIICNTLPSCSSVCPGPNCSCWIGTNNCCLSNSDCANGEVCSSGNTCTQGASGGCFPLGPQNPYGEQNMTATVSASASSVPIGTNVTDTVQFGNSGPNLLPNGASAPAVVSWSSNATLVSYTTTPSGVGSCSSTGGPGGIITCDFGSYLSSIQSSPQNETVSMTVVLHATAAGSLVTQGQISNSGPGCGTIGNGSAATTVVDVPTVTVSANPNPVTNGVSTTLTAAASDPEYSAGQLSYQWTAPAGVTLSNPTAATSGATFPSAGTYSFTVTVTNPSGGSVQGSTQVVVLQNLSSIQVTPNTGTATPGGQIPFSAEAFDQFHQPMVNQPVFTWSVSNGSVGSISPAGLFTASASDLVGTYPNEVIASAGGMNGVATVIINAGTLSKIVVTPNPGTTTPGGTISFSALAEDSAGNPLPVQPTFTWSAVHAAVGSINPTSGIYTAVSSALAGTYLNEVTANAGGTNGSATVIIQAGSLSKIVVSPNPGSTTPGSTISFSAIAEDSAGNPLPAQPTFAWSVASSTVGTINSGSGVFTAATIVLAGTYPGEVVASAGGINGTAGVVIQAGAMTQIKVTPNPGTTTPGGTISFSAVAEDIAGNPLPVQPTFTWGVSNGLVGSINPAGLFTASTSILAGTYSNEVIASANGLNGMAGVVIQAGAFEQIIVSPNPGTTTPGGTISFSAVAEDIAGNPLPAQPTFTWSVASSTVGAINSVSGLFTAATTDLAGTYPKDVVASAGGINGTAGVVIQAGAMTQIKVTPNPGATTPGGTISFSAVAEDSAGNPLPVQPAFTWTVAMSTVGAINSGSGVFTAATSDRVGTYPNEVIASAGGVKGMAGVVIQTGALEQIVVSPNPGTTTPGGTITFSAVAEDIAGNPLPVQPTFTWSVASSTVGAINSGNGLFTAAPTVLAGTYPGEAVAAAGGITGNAGVVINVGAFSQIKVTPNPGTTAPGGTISFSAVAEDIAGNPLPVQPAFAWSIASSTVGAINSGSGLFTAASTDLAGTYPNEVIASAGGVHGMAGVVIEAGAIEQIVVSPNPGTTTPGGTITFSAVAEDIAGNPLPVQPPFAWSIASSTVGAINSGSGLFTAASTDLAGTYPNEAIASAGGVNGTAGVVIQAGAIEQIVVSPNPGTTTPGGTIAFSAVAEDIAGNPLPVQPPFAWSVASSTVGAINSGSGLFTAASTDLAGTYPNEAIASAGGVNGMAGVVIQVGALEQIVVSPNPGVTTPGGTISFSAVAEDIAGNPLLVQPAFAWSVASSTVGTMNSGSGVFTAATSDQVGTYPSEVIASAGGANGMASVIIQAGAIEQIVVSPNPGVTTPGGTISFSAVAEDIAGNPLLVQPAFTWSVASSTVGTIDSGSGLFTAAATDLVGTYPNEVIASAGGMNGMAGIVIQAGALEQIMVSPNPGTAAPGGTIAFSAVAEDIAGNPLPGQPTFAWSVANASIGSIDSATGVFTATVTVPVGDYVKEVIAAVGVVNGKADVDITPPLVDHVIVVPDGETIMVGDALQFTAYAYDVNNQLIVNSTFTWEVLGAAGAISNSGAFRSNGGFIGSRLYTVNATTGGKTGTAHVTVLSPSPYAGSICNAIAYPVPYKSSSGLPGVTFTHLAAGTEIRIFTSDGRIVRTLYSQNGEDVLWDLKNTGGEKVASWVYLYILNQNGPCSNVKGKLVIIQ